MFELIVYIAFGVPGEHQRYAHETVGVYSTYEACDRARWDWARRDAILPGYGPQWTAESTRPGWFQAGVPECAQRAIVS